MRLLHRLSLQQMRLLVETEKTGTLSAAADILSIGASAASKSLSDAERKLGVRLFDRTQDQLVPTSEGQRLIQRIAESLSILARADYELRQVETRTENEVYAGVSNIAGANMFTMLSLALQQTADDVTVKYHMGYSDELISMLLDDELELGILDYVPHPSTGLRCHKLTSEELCVIGVGKHPPTAKLSDLMDRKWALPASDKHLLRKSVDDLFQKECGGLPDSIVEVDDIVTLHGLVGNRGYFSFVGAKFCLLNSNLTVFQPYPIVVPDSQHDVVLAYKDNVIAREKFEPLAEGLMRTIGSIYNSPHIMSRLQLLREGKLL